MKPEPVADPKHPDAEIWAELSDRGDYIDLRPPPHESVLDGRFSIEELEAIVRRLKEMKPE